ncbi:alpha/beta fold hydrolase [Tropicimonas sp.]|uniref:alpha/beta fold hydrolase n=1 Tax=Tropicimonas sp. TaxID=2067044 RepID=UPI003A890D97
MTFEPAPFFKDIANAPQEARAYWATAPDGVRVRLAHYGTPATDTPKGTVLLFPGRTEYVEKYGPAAARFISHGFACVAIDWRGQGLADRQLDDPATGHVGAFREYQHDADLLLELVRALGLPRPLFLLGHSMGGGIGLRSLHRGLPVDAAAFSGPMWGISLPGVVRPLAQVLATLSHSAGFGHTYVPSTKPVTYVLGTDFHDNTLTRDREMFDWLRRQLTVHPELALGGPSMTWLNEALREMRILRNLPPPEIPCLTWVGANERIVDIPTIRRLMTNWPEGTLRIVPEAEHELMMEVPVTRDAFIDAIAAHFSVARRRAAA